MITAQTLPSVHYYYIISHNFKVIVSTNAGPLSLPTNDAIELANAYDARYPGADFQLICKTNVLTEAYVQSYKQLAIAPARKLHWSILSKLEWLERLADNPSMLSWLSENCRQS